LSCGPIEQRQDIHLERHVVLGIAVFRFANTRAQGPDFGLDAGETT
jgi:hypothetical protein